MSTYRLTNVTASGTLAVTGATTVTSILSSSSLGVVNTSLTNAYVKFGHDTSGNFNAGYIGYTYAGNDSLSSTLNIGFITTGDVPQSILSVGRVSSTLLTNLTVNDLTCIGITSTGNIENSGTLVTTNSTASTTTTTGALTVTGGAGIRGAINAGGAIKTFATTTSTNTTTGALIVDGGVGIAGAVNIGGNTALTGTLTVGTTTSFTGAITSATTFSNTTSPDSTTTGAVIVAGGVGIAKDLFAKGIYIVDSAENDLYLTLGKNISGNNNAGYIAFNYAGDDNGNNQISFGYIATGNVRQTPNMIVGRSAISMSSPLIVSGSGTFTSLSSNGADYFSYSEGTWDPGYYKVRNYGGVVTSTEVGTSYVKDCTYVKIGKTVTVKLDIQYDCAGVQAGTMAIFKNLPFISLSKNMYLAENTSNFSGVANGDLRYRILPAGTILSVSNGQVIPTFLDYTTTGYEIFIDRLETPNYLYCTGQFGAVTGQKSYVTFTYLTS